MGAVWKSPTWGSCFHVLYSCTWSVLQDVMNTPVATFHPRLPQKTPPSPWALDVGHPDSWPQWPAALKDFIVCRIFSRGLLCLFLTTLTSSGHVETESCNTACPHSVKLLQTSCFLELSAGLHSSLLWSSSCFSSRRGWFLAPPCPFTSWHFC